MKALESVLELRRDIIQPYVDEANNVLRGEEILVISMQEDFILISKRPQVNKPWTMKFTIIKKEEELEHLDTEVKEYLVDIWERTREALEELHNGQK